MSDAEHVRQPDIIELLLDESFASRYRDLDRMIELAQIAHQAAERLDAGIYGECVVADLRARAWAELGNAYRVCDDINGAQEALEQALVWLRKGGESLRTTTRVANLAASLFSDQGRFADACEILGEVQLVHEYRGEDHLAGRSLISQGLYLAYDHKPEQGILLMCDGLLRLDPVSDPKLKVISFHALAHNLVEVGRFRKARMLLWHIRPVYQQDGDHLSLVRLRWLEGRICSGLDDLPMAEEHFQYSRREFEKCGQHYDCALVSLDLAMLWLRQGRREETRQLALELINYFRALGIAREAAASLIVYRQWAESDYVSNDVLHDKLKLTAALLEELERQKPRRS